MERKKNLPDLQIWINRLRDLEPIAQEIHIFTAHITSLEDDLLASFYGQLENHRQDWMEVIAQGEAQFARLLRDVYRLRFEKPDYVVVGLFGEDHAHLFDLARAYQQLGAAHHLKSEAAWFGHEARELWRHRVDAARFLDAGKLNGFGMALSFAGPDAYLLFEGEGGLHVFIEGTHKKPSLVTIGSTSLTAYKPPEGIEKPGGLPQLAPRRHYDIGQLNIMDFALKRDVRWAVFNATVAQLLEARLQAALEELL